ncbi:MAG: hypothetical protein RIT31_752 [Actinomycetota bacterium]|jgi:hypothetical protein
MKRWVLGLVLVLALSSTPHTYAVPPQSGAKCTNEGSIRIHKQQTFKCTKDGKKLAWVRTNAEKSNKGRVPVNSPISASRVVFDALQVNPSASSDSYIDVRISPKARLINTTTLVSAVNESSRYFRQFVSTDRRIAFWIIGEDEISYLESLITGKSDLVKEYYRELYNSQVGAGFGGVDPEGSAYVIIKIPSDYVPERSFKSRHMVYHEMTHVFQTILIGNNNANWLIPGCDEQKDFCYIWVPTPCWYVEGVAQLFGWARSENTTEASFRTYSAIRNSITDDWNYLYATSSASRAEQISKYFFDPRQKSDGCNSWANNSYFLGHLVAEKFVFDFGLNALFKLSQQMGPANYQLVFKSVTGQSELDWLRLSVLPYFSDLTFGKDLFVKPNDLVNRASAVKYSGPPVVPQPRTFKYWQSMDGRIRIGETFSSSP